MVYDSNMNPDVNKEINATTRWGIGIILTIAIASASFWVSLGNTQSQVNQNTLDINRNEVRIDNLNADIREILVGIEQVKARLGIVEVEK